MFVLSISILGIFISLFYLLARWHPQNAGFKTLRIAFFLLLGLPLLLDLSLVYWWSKPFFIPSDEKIAVIFNHHRKEFEQLKAMVLVDVGLGFNFDFIESNNRVITGLSQRGKPMSPSRVKEYEDLLSKIGTHLNLEVYGKDKAVFMWISVASETTGPIIWDKGIQYLSDEAAAIRSLNKQLKEDIGHQKPLGSDWFIYYREF